jgi:hypothetical protein
MPTYKRKFSRSPEELSVAKFLRLCGEADRYSGLPYSTLTRLAREGRLLTVGRPAMVEREHLNEQQAKDFPQLEKGGTGRG